VTPAPDRVARAVLETSFWVAAHRAEVAANCFDLFEMVVPRAVEAEILARQEDSSQREYPYATLFCHLRPRMVDPPVPAPPSLSVLGPGEAEAIPLALHLDAILLINERRGARLAADFGVDVLTVPGLIVALRSRGVVGDRAAQRKLDLIAAITSGRMIAHA